MKKILAFILAVVMLVSTVAISGIVTASATEETTNASVIDLIPAYGAKDMSVVMDTTTTGAQNNVISDVTTASLTEIAAGTVGVPATNAYFVDINETTAKSGMMFKLDTDIAAVMDDYMNGTLYLDMWVWIADPTYFKVGNVRFFENRWASNTSYVEYQTWDSPDWLLPDGTKGVVAGWNHITVKVNGGGTDTNTTKRRERAQLFNDATIDYVAIYNHAARPCDYAVACARFITLDDAKNDSWDINVEGKNVYRVGDEFSRNDYVVTYKGEVVTDYTVSPLDTTSAVGDTQLVFSVGDESKAFPIRVKLSGVSTYDLKSDTMKTLTGTASLNNDNFNFGNSGVQFYNGTTSEANGNSDIVLSAPVDFLGEDYFETWIYASKEAIEDENLEFLIEFSSGGSLATECIRFRWNNANSYFKFSDTFKEGWNFVKIPLRELHYNGDNVYTDYNTCQVVYNHDSNTLQIVDWTSVDYVRARLNNLDPGGIVIVNGIGFGLGTTINNEAAGYDLVKTIKNASSGDVIKLQKDFELSETLVIDKNITLDLNRYSISGADIQIAADVIFADSNEYLKLSYNGEQIYIGDVNSNIIVNSDASLKIINGDYNVDIENVTINGGNFYSNVTNSIINGGSFYKTVANAVTVNGGKFFGTVENVILNGGIFLENDSYEENIPEMSTIDADNASIKFVGNWSTLKNLKNANDRTLIRASKSGSTIEFTFSGTAVSINGYTSPSYGQISVSVDGGKEEVIDLYSEEATYKKHIFGAYVGDGMHTVKITVLNTKNASSVYSGLYYAAIDTIDVCGEILDISETSAFETRTVELTTDEAKFVIEDAFINGVEKTGLVASAENGVIVVDGSTIYYSAAAAKDTIRYVLNGIQGLIFITYEGDIEAEHVLHDYIQGEYHNAKYGVARFKSWHFNGREAVVIEKGETVEFSFTGESLEIVGYKSAAYGEFELYIDGDYIETISENLLTDHYLYKNSLGTYTTTSGTHTVKIVALGKTLLDVFRFDALEEDNVIKAGTYDITNGYVVSYDYKVIADDINAEDLDVVALQSVDRFASRSQYLDSIKIISQLTGLKYFSFAKAVDLSGDAATYGENGAYGIGILSKYPIKSTNSWNLGSGNVEQRVLTLATIDFNGVDVNVFNSQLSVENSDVRESQFDEIDAVVSQYENVILTGNFGNQSFDEMYQLTILSPVVNSYNALNTVVNEATAFRSQDNIAYSYEFTLKSTGVTSAVHSNHYMLYAELEYTPVTETVTDGSVTPSATATNQTVIYKTVGTTNIRMAIYQPTNKVYDEAPVLLVFPGGGWAYADISGTAGYYSEYTYARANGWAVAVAQYRLCNEEQSSGDTYSHLFADCGAIGMISDTMDAARYLVKHSRLLGFDPTRIVTGGHSAGGYMSLMTGLGDPDDFTMDSAFTRYNLKIHSITAKAGPTNFVVTNDAMADYKNLLNPDYTEEQLILCSPHYYISKNMAPTLICYGTQDEIFNYEVQWIPFGEKAAEVGAAQVTMVQENVNHSLTGSTLSYPAMKVILDETTADAKTLN